MNTTKSQRMQQRGRWGRTTLCLFLLASVLVAFPPGAAYADNPAPVQLFYVTLPEEDGFEVIQDINTYYSPPSGYASYSPMWTYFSIAIGVDGTLVYYDQWENGYETGDLANPVDLYSATNLDGVQIWGNGESDDGCPPNVNGTDITCASDADDPALDAGDVIICYNDVPVPREVAPQKYVLDTFASTSYSRQDGNTNWSTSWDETGDNDSPSYGGDIYIDDGELRFDDSTDAGDSINRGVDLSTGGACATLTFDLTADTSNDDSGDELVVEVSSNGGTSYTNLDTFHDEYDDGDGLSYDISTFATANTRVRFRAAGALEDSENWYIDNVRIDWDCYMPILFDARDKVGASSSVAMARTTWATGSDTLLAFAHEMYATSEWGTEYESPVGTDTANDGDMFQYSALSIMASQNNTTVQIDANADGTYETSVNLNEGGSYLAEGIVEGAAVLADKPVQVLLVTGDIGSTYASRDMNLLPVSKWGSSYWSPVGVVNGTNNTRLFMYNPGPDSIYITVERYGVADTTLGPVAAGDTVTIDLTAGQGAHIYASTSSGTPTDDTISVVGTIDTGSTAYDWSFTLYPDNFLSTDALVGLGLGQDPNQTYSENGNPIWVTAACEAGTWVYVDWNNDGTADPVDTDGSGTAAAGSENGIFVTYLQSVRLFQPDPTDLYAQTGARVWSRTAQNMGDYDDPNAVPGCNLAMAWGQDPANASASAPGLDVGTSIPPLRLVEGTKTLTWVDGGDIAPVGVLNPGDTVYYNITIRNAGASLISGVRVYDTVPPNTTYVGSTTEKDVGSGWTSIPDDGGFPLDVTGGVLLGDLAAGATFYVRFQVTLDSLAGGDYEEITNCDTAITQDAGSFERCVTRPVATRDWGDLPDSYGTSAAQNGPRHSWSGLTLGSAWDLESGGPPTAGANGDDNATTDDEDGITNNANGQQWYDGQGSLNVTVAGGSGCLNAWMDFTGDAGTTLVPDGSFVDLVDGGYDRYPNTGETYYSEYIIQNLPVSAGTTPISLVGVVPAGLNGGATSSFYLRFRLTQPEDCTNQNVAPTGFVAGGEVEDYLLSLGTPTAVKLLSFTATGAKKSVTLRWETDSEVNNVGFNLFRAEAIGGETVRVNTELIPAASSGTPYGASYEYTDTDVRPNRTYLYWLEDVDIHGRTERHGPVEATTGKTRK